MSVEKVWKTKAGHKAVVIFASGSHRCGYVGVPEGHPLYAKQYNEQLPYLKSLEADEEVGDRGPIAIFLAALSGNYQSMDYVFDVHGGITWSNYLVGPVPTPDAELTAWDKEATEAGLNDGLWYIGYDCAHYGDGLANDPSTLDPVRSLEYCIEQCEKLSKQIVDRVIYQ